MKSSDSKSNSIYDPYPRPHDSWVVEEKTDDPRNDIESFSSTKNRKKYRSLRVMRRNFTIAITLATLAALSLGIWEPWRAEVLGPGPLSSSHAQLLNGPDIKDRCATCHDAGSTHPVAWLVDTLTGGSHLKVPQSEKCMICHADTLRAEHAISAHNIPKSELSKISEGQNVNQHASLMRMIGNPSHKMDEIACAACHREHHGKHHELAALTDQQCQTCHQEQFDSFVDGHPEFTNYTTHVSLGIEFNHSSHMLKHFSASDTTFDCKKCHTADERGNVQLLTGFDQACAACHEKAIDSNISDGIVLLKLPTIDLQVLAASSGRKIGEWPTQATGDFDGTLPPMMKLLLSADSRAKETLEKLGNDFDFFELDPENGEQVAAAVDLVFAIKRLIHDLAMNGREGIRERLESSLHRQVDQTSVSIMSQQLSVQAIVDMQKLWFPNLQSEIEQLAGDAVNSKSGNDVRQIMLASFQERQSTTLYENPLKQFYSSDKQTDGSTISSPDETNPTELLIENPLKGYGKQPPLTEKIELIQPDQVDEANPNSIQDVETPNVKDHYQIADQDHGWSRNDATLTLTYRPSGHADQFVAAWLNFASQASASSGSDSVTASLDAHLNPTGGTGYCLSCHQPSHELETLGKIEWIATYRDTSRRSFTQFNHAPHVIQTSLFDCQSCHELGNQSSKQTDRAFKLSGFQVAKHAPTKNLALPHHSDFIAIGKQTCAQCHNQSAVSQNCSTCHGYHIGSKVLSR